MVLFMCGGVFESMLGLCATSEDWIIYFSMYFDVCFLNHSGKKEVIVCVNLIDKCFVFYYDIFY